jgi:hypothetical protein
LSSENSIIFPQGNTFLWRLATTKAQEIASFAIITAPVDLYLIACFSAQTDAQVVSQQEGMLIASHN